MGADLNKIIHRFKLANGYKSKVVAQPHKYHDEDIFRFPSWMMISKQVGDKDNPHFILN